MDRIHYSRWALIKWIILILVFLGPAAAGILLAPDMFEGRGSGVIGLLLRATGAEGRLALAAFCGAVLIALVFRSARLLCGSGLAASFDAQGLMLNNGWRMRTASWSEVLGADVLTREVRVRGTVRSFDILTIRLIRPGGSEHPIKLHLGELRVDWANAKRWCEAMREAQKRALTKPLSAPSGAATPTAGVRSFGRRVVSRP